MERSPEKAWPHLRTVQGPVGRQPVIAALLWAERPRGARVQAGRHLVKATPGMCRAAQCWAEGSMPLPIPPPTVAFRR